jgi:hypothetical protein
MLQDMFLWHCKKKLFPTFTYVEKFQVIHYKMVPLVTFHFLFFLNREIVICYEITKKVRHAIQ